jgi:hypothetical protein
MNIISKIDTLIENLEPVQNPAWKYPTYEEVIESLKDIRTQLINNEKIYIIKHYLDNAFDNIEYALEELENLK